LLHFDSSKRCVCPLYKILYAFKVVKLFLKHPVHSLSEHCNGVQICRSSQPQLCYCSIKHSLTITRILQNIITLIKTAFVKQSYLSQYSRSI